jgi:predicted TIM-barrel fold metal-dependent hydrolase
MVVDTHVHLIRPFDSQGNRQVYSPNPTGAEDYVALMEASGIDRAFFISWSPEDIPSDLSGKGIAVESVRETMSREYALEAMRAFPDRFYWFPCHLGPGLGDACAMARANLELGAAGLKLVCSFWGELPDDDRLLPLYALAQEYGAHVIIDTSFWYLGKDEPADPERLPPGHREVAKRIRDFQDYLAHLRPIAAAHPGVNFLLAHAGARTFTPEHAAEVGCFIREYPNLFADLAALPTEAPALDRLVEVAGADRILFGTDWPHFAQGEAMARAIAQIRRPGRFAAGDAARILGENAVRFVGGRNPGLRR